MIDKIKMTSAYYEKLKREYGVIEFNEIKPFGMLGIQIQIDDTLPVDYEIIQKTLT